jgi:TolB-like protein
MYAWLAKALLVCSDAVARLNVQATLRPRFDGRILLPNGARTTRSRMAENQAPESQAAPGRDVFISYASHDKAVAEAVCEALESAGVACWIAPRNVTPGEFYAESIVHAIDSAKVVVVVLSQNAAASQHVLREVERASSKRHPVVSFRIDAAPLPAGLEYFLNSSQWLDASATGIDRAFPPLVDAVRSALALPSSAVPFKAGPTAAARVSPATRYLLVALAAVLVSVFGYFTVKQLRMTKGVDTQKSPVEAAPASAAKLAAAPAVPDKSVAVLPFIDMSEKRDQEYFSEGLSEELIDLLSKVSALRVPARTSSFYFKDKSEDIPTIARRLMVAHVLEGSVRKAGDHVRITVQLVRADNGYHLWSQTYDRKLDDIFKVQDDIASAVVAALKVSLLGAEAPRATPTSNSEAYTLYLQAKSVYWNGNTHADSERAFVLLRQALKLDPGFARGWAALAMFRCGDAAYFDLSLDTQGRLEAHDAAARALKLDPDLSDSHAAMGRFLNFVEWNWKGAEVEYRRALALDPFQEVAVLDLASLLATLDTHSAEAISLGKRAIDHDPTNLVSYLDLGNTYVGAGRFAEAEQAVRTAVELAPQAEQVASTLAWVLMYRGALDAALAELEREPGERFREALRPTLLDALGRVHEANGALATFQAKFGSLAPYAVADVYARRNDLDRAFDWLDRAYRQREPSMVSVRWDPDLSNLRPDPRYKALLRKMNLPE